jgi:aminopeptidase N
MLAMENKSLNVFNTSCVLADPKTSSDANYARVEGIIGHVRDIIVAVPY